MVRSNRLAVVSLLVLALAGCAPSPNRGAPASPPQPPSRTELRVSGSGTALPALKKVAEAYAQQERGVGVQIQGGPTPAGRSRACSRARWTSPSRTDR